MFHNGWANLSTALPITCMERRGLFEVNVEVVADVEIRALVYHGFGVCLIQFHW